MRRDIAQLPCVVGNYTSTADEAASFVHLNQKRKPLGKLDVFKAAVARIAPRIEDRVVACIARKHLTPEQLGADGAPAVPEAAKTA